MLDKNKRASPEGPVASIKTDLKKLPPEENVLIWFGHSSYYFQADEKKILVDPVFNGHASPVSFSTKAFKGSNIYTAEDLPEIDYLFITHDHWDHLDYRAVRALKLKIKESHHRTGNRGAPGVLEIGPLYHHGERLERGGGSGRRIHCEILSCQSFMGCPSGIYYKPA